MMIKEVIKTIIADFHKQGTPEVLQRDIRIPIDSKKITVLVGPRRAGKTYMLYSLMKQITDLTNILYINFEDERLNINTDDLQTILESYFELYPEKKNQDIYIFFDEIQEVKGWEKFVRRIYDNITTKIFITGSSAKMLSKEIATSLRGRLISYEVYPLSFKEYLNFKSIELDLVSTRGKARIIHEFDIYLQKGGFPETLSMEQEVYNKTISSYFEVMLYRDVIERYSISKPLHVKELLRYLLSQTANEFSINKIYNDFKSKGMKLNKDSLYKYLDYFEDAFIIIPINNYSESIRKQTLRKSYTIDPSLAKLVSFSLDKDYGRLLETIVLIELKRRGKQIFYFKNGEECDFIIKEENEITEAIQVCYNYNDENKEREDKGLKKAIQRFKLNKATIISYNKTKETTEIVEWLLDM